MGGRVWKCYGVGRECFWAFNAVANYVYPRWDIAHDVVEAKIIDTEKGYFESVTRMDAELSMETDRTRAVEKMTTFSVSLCNAVVDAWFNLFRYLMVTFRDGFIVTPRL